MKWTVLYHKMQPYLHIRRLVRIAEDWHRSKRPATITKEIVAYGTRINKVNVLQAYYGYGRTTLTATGVLHLRLRAYDAYGYGRNTLAATGVLGLRLRAYYAYATGISWLQLRVCYRRTMWQGVS